MALLVPTGQEAGWAGGQLYYLPLGKDTFVHFTLKSRIEQILAAGKLLMRPPYKKFGADHVAAVSAVWGYYVPGVQTTHTKVPAGDELIAIVFKTSTMPRPSNFPEEVTWDRDVALQGARVVSSSQGASMLKKTPERLASEDDAVTYVKPSAAQRVAARWAAAHPSLGVGSNNYGQALFARRPFAKGEHLCPLGGPVSASGGPVFQVGAQAYMGPSGGVTDALNHSCDPNCAAMVEQRGYPVVAIRDIENGEEVTIDYAVTSTNPSDGLFECLCGSPNCRGEAGGGFHTVPAWQKLRYLALGIVPSYVG